MRRLLYVPIIHEQADLGSAGAFLAQRSWTQARAEHWVLHEKTVQGFWEEIERFLSKIDPRTIRIYQDGLAADGALGRRVVEEGARRGSRNYRVILALLDKGAELRATEDADLLLQEHDNLRRAGHPSSGEREHLLARRDAYTAERINSTLQEGEVGVLFIGAGHTVSPNLGDDILVRSVKDPERLHRYIQVLLLGDDRKELTSLAAYVAGPVEDSSTKADGGGFGH